ncbi:MAG: hypothetical protein EPN49_10090 [Rhodanobacter sp.]|nr:MAG: hypothetical protein EPN49_10090 [Rhodanobacter sp.]
MHVMAGVMLDADGRALRAHAWLIRPWQGSPQSLDGQSLQWQMPAQVDPAILAPADREILQALQAWLAKKP